MGQDVANLDAFKGGPSHAFMHLNPQEENLSDGIGSSYGVLNYKGKVWSLRYRGEKKIFVRPDDGQPTGYIDVVILHQAKVKSKSYFKAYDPGGTSEGERPICASIDGINADADVAVRQGVNGDGVCALCPRNEWKTLPNGKKGRECQDYKRLAVLLLPNQTKVLFGEPLMEPVFLRVPPASLNNLALMGEQMAPLGYHFSAYITRITFDAAESHPKMVFRAVQPLGEKEASVVLPCRDDPLCMRIVGIEHAPVALITHSPAQNPAPAMTASVTAPVTKAPPPATQAPTTIDAGFTVVEELAPAFVPPAVATLAVTPPISFGEIPPGGVVPPAVAPAAQTVADTGEPDEADAALDARIAALMPHD